MNPDTASDPAMSSMLKAIPRLTSAQLLTSSLPRFYESLIQKPLQENVSNTTPVLVSWPRYAANGQFTHMTDLLKSRPAAKVVAIGEHHHQPAILKLQLQMLDQLSSRHPDEIVLVVEYFNLRQGKLLTEFNGHKIGISQLALAYAESSENFNVDDHLGPLLLLAREKNVPIVAGFPPREWARDFLKDPGGVLSRLKDDFAFDRPEDITPKTLEHEAYIETMFSGEAPRKIVPDGEERRGARILPAQLLKDAVMAWSIDQQLASGKRVLALAGAGHLEYGFGVLERVREAKNEEKMLIVCKSKNDSKLWLRKEGGGYGAAIAEEVKRQTETTMSDRPIADAVYLYDAV